MVVWKFALNDAGPTALEIPAGGRVLTVRLDENSRLFLWALVDPVAAVEQREFVAVATGEDLPCCSSYRYIGSYVYRQLDYVGHVFEVTQ